MENCTLVIFGGTGDLTKRKLIPAVRRLVCERNINADMSVLAVGRREMTTADFREEMRLSLSVDGGIKLTEEQWSCLYPRLNYMQLDFVQDSSGYFALESLLQRMESEGLNDADVREGPQASRVKDVFNQKQAAVRSGNRLYYLAIAPEHFSVVVSHLSAAAMLSSPSCVGFRRVLVEKPFGRSLEDAEFLNKHLLSHLEEKDIFRIDHYLGKEMLQDILAVRFGNAVFEPLWNHRHIEHVRIISHETLGVESRGGYFDNSGILKDMVQNHLLQMLSLIAMEPPVKLDPESIRDEKVKVMRALRPYTLLSAKSEIVRGQYGEGYVQISNGIKSKLPAYREEPKVASDSDTETYVILKTWVDNLRWGGVPFYLEAGKRMKKKETSIIIQFKPLSGIQPYDEFNGNSANRLVFEIQPREGFHFMINGKRPDADWAMDEVAMEYCQSCRADNNSPEAYERILLEAWRNNSSLFSRWDELAYSWSFIDTIRSHWSLEKPEFPNYAAGSDGPLHTLL